MLLRRASSIYGVIAYSVAERTLEMGIRLALGADGRDILRLVLGHGLVLAGTGIRDRPGGGVGLDPADVVLTVSRECDRPRHFPRGPGVVRGRGAGGELSSGAAGDARGPGDRAALGVTAG